MNKEFIKKLLEHLEIYESGKIHKNKNEETITSPRGVYSKYHPNAKVFKVIAKIAKTLNIVAPYSKTDIKEINKKISDSRTLSEEIYEAEIEFYTEYIKRSKAEYLPVKARMIHTINFVNSEKGAIYALQYAIKKWKHKYKKDIEISTLDGTWGRKTRITAEAMLMWSTVNDDRPFLIEEWLSTGMKEYYRSLPAKHNIHKNGWLNRVEEASFITNIEKDY